ncbi:hypothetical protein K1719_011001 [Acacia pycnantha]|nr:hypothetical protein K1719_011001 [Acacia pycnantha]
MDMDNASALRAAVDIKNQPQRLDFEGEDDHKEALIKDRPMKILLLFSLVAAVFLLLISPFSLLLQSGRFLRFSPFFPQAFSSFPSSQNAIKYSSRSRLPQSLGYFQVTLTHLPLLSILALISDSARALCWPIAPKILK